MIYSQEIAGDGQLKCHLNHYVRYTSYLLVTQFCSKQKYKQALISLYVTFPPSPNLTGVLT